MKREESGLTDLLLVNGAKREDLFKLPVRKWDDEYKRYDSILILADGKKHDSGWGLIVVIGCIKNSPIEIACNCAEDINWTFAQQPRMDCALPSRGMHFWCRNNGRYQVGAALISTDIYLHE